MQPVLALLPARSLGALLRSGFGFSRLTLIFKAKSCQLLFSENTFNLSTFGSRILRVRGKCELNLSFLAIVSFFLRFM